MGRILKQYSLLKCTDKIAINLRNRNDNFHIKLNVGLDPEGVILKNSMPPWGRRGF